MKEKFKKSDYPLRFINRKINEFWKGKYHGDERFLIPPNLFGIPTPFISIEIPYCQLKKYKSKHFLKKNLQIYRAVTTSKSRKVQPLFSLKCKSDYRLFGIYKGDCSCGSRYIGKTRHNADVRWNKHNNSTKVQNHRNTFEYILTTIWHGLLFQMLQKILRQGRT